MNSAFVGYEELSRSRRVSSRPKAEVDNTFLLYELNINNCEVQFKKNVNFLLKTHLFQVMIRKLTMKKKKFKQGYSLLTTTRRKIP